MCVLALRSSCRVGHLERKFNAMSDFMPTAAKRLTTRGKNCLRVDTSLSSVLVAKSRRLRRCRQYRSSLRSVVVMVDRGEVDRSAFGPALPVAGHR